MRMLTSGWRLIKRARERWREEDGDQRAAAFAWYLQLALFPLVIMLVIAGSLFVESETATRGVSQLANRYAPLTPEQERTVSETIRGLLEARGKINLAAFALLIWSSLGFLRVLIRTSNRIWHSQAYNWWRLPSKSLCLLGIATGAVLIGIVLPFAARLVQRWFAIHFELPSWASDWIFSLIPWLILLCGLIMIYKLAPSRPVRFSEVWIGALGATVLIWIGQLLFLFFVANSARFNILYGALGGTVAFLLWIYLSSCICVFGICFCAVRAEIGGKER